MVDGGLIRWSLESLLSAFKGQRRRREPLFRQAERLLGAFEAHGVPPHQLPRLMPESIRLTPQQTGSTEAFASDLRIEHLDWASKELALRRDWLDLEGDQPHHVIHVYKQPRLLFQWLQEREMVRGNRFGSVHVLTEAIFEDPGIADGRFVVIYEEGFNEIDEKSLSRYWYLSEGSHFDHSPCVIDLLGILAIAEHFTLMPVGHVISEAATLSAEQGTLGLIPSALKRKRGWRPQDWVPLQYETANCETDRHRDLWEQTRERLLGDGLEQVLTLHKRP